MRRTAAIRLVCVALGALLAPLGSASAVTITPGANTVVAARVSMTFGPSSPGDPERVDSLRWIDSNGVQSGNLAAQASGGCNGDAVEFFGQSYGGAGAFVVAGSAGSWTSPDANTVQIDSAAATSCGSNIPVRTTYTFYDVAPAYNEIAVTRRWDFSASHPSGDIRAYVPRLDLNTYSQTLYPSGGMTPSLQAADPRACPSGCIEANWAGTWFAINDPTTGRGLVVLRDAGDQVPGQLVVDNDSYSSSNLSDVDLQGPASGGWTGLVSETEYLCLYDLTSWPQSQRDQLEPPAGCGPVPVNTSPPTVSGDMISGHQLTADPGKWTGNPTFTYQWRRCDSSGANCTDIPGATDKTYTVTDPDVGSAIIVHVTATSPGGGSATADSAVNGAATGPRAALSPASIDFGPRSLGSGRPPQSVSVLNTGTASLHIGAIQLAGSRSDAFTVPSDGCNGQTLAPGAACTLQIAFAPPARGPFTAQVMVADDAPGSPQTVPLAGTGIAPTATFVTTSLDFGDVLAGGAGESRTVTVTNHGPDPLEVTSARVTGPQAAAFTVTSACGRVDPGGSCAIGITFAPSTLGRYAATLQLGDDAADSPQTLNLAGAGTPALAGRILDESGRPLGGVVVSGCVSGRCASAASGPDGQYELVLPPGLARLEAYPPNPNLIGGSATVQILPGQAATQDLRLHAPVPLSGGTTFLTPGGMVDSGVPVVRWDAPFSFNMPIYVSSTGPPSSAVLYSLVAGIDNDTGDGPGGFALVGVLMFTIDYGADGRADGISQIVTGQLDCGAVGAPSSCGDLAGDAAASPAGQPASAARLARGGAAAAIGDENALLFHTPANQLHGVQNVVISSPDSAGSLAAAPVALGPSLPAGQTAADSVTATQTLSALSTFSPYHPPQAPGGGPIRETATFAVASLDRQAHGAFSYFSQQFGDDLGVPTTPAAHTADALISQGIDRYPPDPQCPYGVEVHRFTHSDSASVWWAELQAMFGGGEYDLRPDDVKVCVPAPPPPAPKACVPPEKWHPFGGFPPCKGPGGGFYIDPSGRVVTSADAPLAGATVRLTRATTRTGRQIAVPRGSPVMSPDNRRNPDRTGPLGTFGWDVIPGYYRVTATKPACHARHGLLASTPVLTVPPPAVNLTLTLICPRLRRASTRTHVRATHGPHGALILRAKVLARGHAPGHLNGTVTFRVGRQSIGSVEADPATGLAVLTSPLRLRRATITAIFSGNAYLSASEGRARIH
jgi:hypothetical protein